ncbi:peptidylprolyl isomerase [Aquimarina hainanensis]|uniref:Peptidyl-prolyl cis-trans isomerase n=1 Tax=Aquimarina hainanensis TaxID=1578017 RepID=A0ABW5N356_9FLAO
MSFVRIFYIISCATVFFLSSCEDKQSKQKIPPIKNIKKTTTSSKSATDTASSTPKEEKKEDIEAFRLSNDNLHAFFEDYGKKHPESLVKVTTKFGDIHIKLYKETPLHRANFIYLVKEKYFDETFFYRVAKGFVIQGGNSDRQQMAQRRFEIGDYTLPQEPIKQLKHVRGAVALSKQWVDNPSNRSTPFEFFIVAARKGAPHLDGEHTIFGKVIKGMSVVDKISNVPVDGSEWPIENIFIKATVIK